MQTRTGEEVGWEEQRMVERQGRQEPRTHGEEVQGQLVTPSDDLPRTLIEWPRRLQL